MMSLLFHIRPLSIPANSEVPGLNLGSEIVRHTEFRFRSFLHRSKKMLGSALKLEMHKHFWPENLKYDNHLGTWV
jgi:hypothetical protein